MPTEINYVTPIWFKTIIYTGVSISLLSSTIVLISL